MRAAIAEDHNYWCHLTAISSAAVPVALVSTTAIVSATDCKSPFSSCFWLSNPPQLLSYVGYICQTDIHHPVIFELMTLTILLKVALLG